MKQNIYRFLRFIYDKELIIGIVILVVSFLLFLYHHPVYSLGISWLGFALLVDFANKKITGHSFFPINELRMKDFFIIAGCGILFCFIIEFFGVYTTRSWFYPSWSAMTYFILAPGAFLVYSLVLLSLYEMIKQLIAKYTPKGKPSEKEENFYKKFMLLETVLGPIGLIISFFYVLNILARFEIGLFNFSASSGIEVEWWVFLVVGLSIFFIFESIAYRQKKETMTRDMIGGNFIPLFAIIIANCLSVLFFEFPNGPLQVWVFDNWAFNNLRLLNIPLVAFLAWPFQFLMLLSILRVAFKTKKIDIW